MPYYSEKCIEQIKDRLPISSVMSEYARLEKKGGSYWVKCPFHGGGNEKTASCKLDDDKGMFHCFGCGEGGNIFSLVMKKEHIDFPSSVEKLAKKAGVAIEEERNGNSEEAAKSRKEKEALYELYSRLAQSFHHILLNTEEGKLGRDYLEKRKISRTTTEKFLLGYAPRDPSFLLSFLRKRGYSEEFLYSSGLFSQSHYPLFRCRLMFPIRERNGRVIAFSGRDLSFNDKSPKYINSPETRIYQKKENFFGLFEAKEAISKGKDPILCEGNFDVISMSQAGYEEAVASLGTSFTIEQCLNMKKWFPSVKGFNLLFDSDEAGQRSSERVIRILNHSSLSQSVHVLSSSKDASELLEKSGIEGIVNEYTPFVSGFDFLLNRAKKLYSTNSGSGKKSILRMLSGYLYSSDIVMRDEYITRLEKELDLNEEAINVMMGEYKDSNDLENDLDEAEKNNEEDVSFEGISNELKTLLYLSNHRDLYKSIFKIEVSIDDLTLSESKYIYSSLEEMLRRGGYCTDEEFLTLINDNTTRQYVYTSYSLDTYTRDNNELLSEGIYNIKIAFYEHKVKSLDDSLRFLSSSEQKNEVLDEIGEYQKKIENLKLNRKNLFQKMVN